MLGGRHNDQHLAPLAVAVQPRAAAEDAFAVLPQNLRVAV
jgi:hypothetical protein